MSNSCTKKARAILFLSLALNVFALGYIFGGGGHGWGGHRPPFGGFGKQIETLAEPAKTDISAVMDQYKPKLKAQMQKVRDAREQAEKAIKDPHYTRKQVEPLFAKLKVESDKAQALAQQMMLDVADKLSPEERVKFFNRPSRGYGRASFGRPQGHEPPARSPTDNGPPVGDASPSP